MLLKTYLIFLELNSIKHINIILIKIRPINLDKYYISQYYFYRIIGNVHDNRNKHNLFIVLVDITLYLKYFNYSFLNTLIYHYFILIM